MLTTLVRRRAKEIDVRISAVKVGNLTKTDVAVVYIHNLADEALVQQLFERLGQVSQDRVLEGEYREEILLGKKQVTIFPVLGSAFLLLPRVLFSHPDLDRRHM